MELPPAREKKRHGHNKRGVRGRREAGGGGANPPDFADVLDVAHAE
jgi:hypothetical protein